MSVSASGDNGIVVASAAGGVSLMDKTIVHVGGGATRTAGISIMSDGTVRWPRTFTFVQLNPLTDWIIPNISGAAYDVRLTNLTWITKDEGFVVSPSGGSFNDPGVTPGGDSDGDEDTWYDLGTDRYWVMYDNDDIDSPVGNQHATFDIQIRKGGTTLATAAMDWSVGSNSGGGGGGGGGCYMYGTEFIMADDSLKEIQDITIGEVMKEGGRVKATQIGDATKEAWFDIDGVVSTGTHGVCIDGVWMRVEDAGYPQVDGADTFYVVSNEKHKMLAANGVMFTDYQEIDYMSSGWDDWVISHLNQESDVDVLRNAIISTGLESKRAKARYLCRRL